MLQPTKDGLSAGWFSQELKAFNLKGTIMLGKVTNIQISVGKPERKTCLGYTDVKGKLSIMLSYHVTKCIVECRHNTILDGDEW